METILRNNNITLKINHFWAEINSLLYKNREIIYKKQENFWQRQSPVLFPIVGALEDNSYIFEGQTYHLWQHGFARDMNFDLEDSNHNSATFTLKSWPETYKKYPFDFKLSTRYIILENSIEVHYIVKNIGNTDIFFSLGIHPAFHIWTNIEQYSLVFNKNNEWQKVDRLKNGIIFQRYEENFWDYLSKKTLQLKEKFFEKDAMILRKFWGDSVDFYEKNEKIFTMSWENFPHLGIWKQPNAPFICIEPWDWFADEFEQKWDFTNKWGINKLAPNTEKKYSWKLEF